MHGVGRRLCTVRHHGVRLVTVSSSPAASPVSFSLVDGWSRPFIGRLEPSLHWGEFFPYTVPVRAVNWVLGPESAEGSCQVHVDRIDCKATLTDEKSRPTHTLLMNDLSGPHKR